MGFGLGWLPVRVNSEAISGNIKQLTGWDPCELVETSMSILKDISLETLKRAAEIRQQIIDLENELDSLLSGKSAGNKKTAKKTAKRAKKKATKRKLSPEAIQRIKDAQKRRWAKVRKEAAGRPPQKKKTAAKRKSK